jgi:hypothetical protein
VSGHTPWAILREEFLAKPGGPARLEAARREQEREYRRLRWRLRRGLDRLRSRLF